MKNKNWDKITLVIEKFAKTIVRLRWFLIPAVSLAAIICTAGLFHLRTSTALENLFLKDDPVIVAQKQFDSIFGNSDFIGILVETDDVFDRASFSLLNSLSEDLRKNIPYITDVSSILKFSRKDPMAMTTDDLEKLRQTLDIRDSVKSVMYSKDYKQAWILCSLSTYPKIDKSKDVEDPSFIVGREVMNIINKYKAQGYHVYATGIPVLEYRKTTELTDDMIRVIIVAAIAAVLLLVLLTRSMACTIGSILVTAMTLLSLFGVMGWMHRTVDMTFMLVPILLTIAVSIGYSIHVFNFFKREMAYTGKRKESVITALTETGWPVFFTALTTIFALFSFITVPIGVIQWVGLVSALAIVIVYLLTLFFLAPVLSLGKDKLPLRSKEIPHRSETFFERMSIFVMNHKRSIVIIYLIIMVAAAVGLSQIKVDIKAMKMMGMKMPHIQDQYHIAQSDIGINYSYSIALVFPDKNEALTPEILDKVDQLTKYIYKTPYIKRVTSINDIVKELNRLRHGDNPEYNRVPDKESMLKGLVTYARRLSGESIQLVMDQDNKSLRIIVEMNEVSTSSMVKHIAGVNGEIDRLFPSGEYKGIRHYLVGSVIQLSVMNQYITVGLIRSVVMALIIISLMMMIVFRSVKLGLISMIPNVSPVIIAGGFMGLMGESLDFVTMTIAPMVIGLAVDDTIHFINHVKVDFNRNGNYDGAIRHSFVKVGEAMALATLILCTTFLMFTTSIAHSMVNMGIYINIGMIAALIADFTITPILIEKSKPFGKES